MFGRKKGFTASQSKRMSRRMQSSTIGSHVERPSARHRSGARRGEPRGASSVDFSNVRRSSQASRRVVSHVGAATTSAENENAYARRVARRGYVQEIQRKARMRRIIVAVVAVFVVAAIAVGVGVATYFGTSDSRLSLSSSNASEALVAAEADAPFYVLCAAELDEAKGASSDAYLLVRVDEGARSLSFVAIPSNLNVKLSDGQTHPLREARATGGDAELIRSVASLADVSIAHFITTDEEGIAGMVERVGGVTMTIPEEVDDPRAGTLVLDAGEQTLDAEAALVLLRAKNYTTGLERTAANQIDFTRTLCQRALSTEGLDFAALVGEAGNYLHTDWSSSDLLALGNALRPLDQVTVYSCLLPGYESDGDDPRYEYSSSEWEPMRERFKAGEDPNQVESSGASVNPADVTVEVRNGAGATGAAARLGEMLTAAGYQVGEVGNVDDGTVYPETLVIYKGAENEGAAKAVVSAISGGRVVNGGDFYTFDANVLVIIGKDWMPVS